MFAELDELGFLEGEPDTKESVISPAMRTPQKIGLKRLALDSGTARRRSGVKVDQGDDLESPESKVYGLQTVKGDPDDELGVKDELQDSPDKHCLGCKRSLRTGSCFVRPSMPLQWSLSEGRGSWCKDCFGVWRLCYAGELSLARFGTWLRHPSNAAAFELVFIVYMCLKKEGVERVTEAMVATRRASMDWAMRMMPIPSGPFEVARLSELRDHENLEAARLVPFVSVVDGRRELGYLLDVKPPHGGFVVPRPLDASWSGLQSRTSLSTDQRCDLDILARAFPAHSSTGDNESSSSRVAIDNAPTKAESKIEGKYNTAIGWTLSHLQPFATPGWKEVREGQFTSIITKLTDLKTEAAMADSSDLVASLQKWVEALSRAKVFVKRHKEYAKKPKTSTLIALSPHIEDWVDCLTSHRVAVHWDLVALSLKVRFVVADAIVPMAARVNELRNKGLDKCLLEMGKGGTPAAEAWLRGTIFQAIGVQVAAASLEQCDEVRERLMKDIDGCIQSLRGLLVASQLEALTQDLQHVWVTLAAGADSLQVKVPVATAALDALQVPRFTLMLCVLEGAPVGVEFLAGLRDFLKRGANDAAGDSRMTLARQSIADEGLLGLSLEGETVSLVNAQAALVGDAAVFSIFAEILQYIVEAVGFWSRDRINEVGDEIDTVIRKIGDAFIAYDILYSLVGQHLLQSCGGNLAKIEPGAPSNDNSLGAEFLFLSAFQAQYAQSPLATAFFRGGAVVEGRDELLAGFARVGHSLREALEEKANFITTVASTVEHNKKLQAKCGQVLSSVSYLPACGCHESPGTWLKKWEADPSDSFMTRALEVISSVKDLEATVLLEARWGVLEQHGRHAL